MPFTPYSYRQYPCDGSNKTFSVPFPFLLRAHVRVYLGYDLFELTYASELVDGTDFTWISDTSLVTTVAQPAGTILTVIRLTPTTVRLVDWNNGSPPTPTELDLADLQVFYALQEQSDKFNKSVETTITIINATISANGYERVANIGALPASPTQGQLIEIIDSTGIESNILVSGKPTGFVGSSNLSPRLKWSAGSWVFLDYRANDPDKRYLYSRNVFEFSGIVGDGSNDDTAGLQAALDWAQGGTANQGPYRRLHAPAGYKFRTTSPLYILKPCIFECLSFINYNSSTGQAAVVVGGNPALNPGRNKGYDIHLVGLRHTSDGTAGGGWGHSSYPYPNAEFPSGVNGIELRSAQMSVFRVDEIQAFKGAGCYMNCGGAASDVGFNAHFQQNTVILGEIGYCSYGIRARSKDAGLSAAQANEIIVKSINGNFKNIKLDESGGTYYNSGSNILRVNAMEAAQLGGIEMEVYSAYNEINFGFFNGMIKFNDQSGVGTGGFSACFNIVTTANSVREPSVTGTITSATTSTFTVAGAGWAVNQYQNRFVYFPSIDATVRVLSNTATAMSFASIVTGGNLSAAPAGGAQYQIMSDGVSVVDITNSGSKNRVFSAPPSPVMFPVTKTLVANTIYKNETNRLLSVAFTANLPNGTSVELRCGPASTSLPTSNKASNSNITGTLEAPMYLVVPQNHYYQVSTTGSVTLSTVRLQDL